MVCTVWNGHAGTRVPLHVLPEGGALRGCCQSGVRASNHAFGAGMLVSGCLSKVLLEGAVKLAYWCCCEEGAQCTQLVLLQGAAVRVACPLWSWPAGAAARCCYKVLQLKWCALWSWHVGAIAGCCCRAHKTQVLILQMYQGSEWGSLRHDSGMIRGMIRKHFFFWIQEPLLLESLFLSVNLPQLLRCNGSTCQTTRGRT